MINRYKNLSLPAKATIWFTICNFVLKGISFITVPIFTRLIPSDEYGILSVYLSYEQLILIFATWEIQLGAYQKGVFKYKEDVYSFTMATQALVNIITIGCFTIILIFNGMVTSITGMPPVILLLLFIHLLFRPSYTCWLIRQRKDYKYKSSVAITLIYGIVSVIVPMIAVLLIDKTANVKYGATLIGTTIICVCFFFKHASYWHLIEKVKQVKAYWKFCVAFEGPEVLHSLSFLVLSQADRVMISMMVGSSQAAFYTVAYTIASVVSIFQNSISTSLVPWRYQMLEEKKYDSIRNVTNGLLIGFGMITLLFIIVVPEMMRILFTSDYYEAVWCIPPVALGVYFMFLYSIFVNVEEYFEKTLYVVYVSFTCGIINIILNYFCIGIFGYISCAYTTAVSYILFAVGHFVFMKKTLMEQNIKDCVVDGKKVFAISFVVLVGSIIITVLYNYAMLRYILFVLAIVISALNRNRIHYIFAIMKRDNNK